MRGSLGRFASTSSSNCGKQNLVFSSSAFSTFAGGGGSGRGRGRGSGSSTSPNPSQFTARTPGKPDNDGNNDIDTDDSFFPSGLGHGRGKPIPATPVLPSFSSWMSTKNPSAGRGGGRTSQQQPNDRPSEFQGFQPKTPIFFSREDSEKTQLSDPGRNSEEGILPSGLLPGLPSAGRGKPSKERSSSSEENRHIRSRRGGAAVGVQDRSTPSPPRLSREEAIKKAVGILSRGGGGGGGGGGNRMEEGGGRGRGLRGRGGRGRGGRGVQGWRGRGGRSGGRFRDSDEDFATGLYLGDNADGERLAKRIGPEKMDKLVEAFEEMSYRVLPSPMDDAYMDAVHTNNLIEYEPEYLMEEFGTNPDIDDTPPIPLRDALEKMKPFLMAYEGIQSQEEWEEIMKETMEKLPYMKELIDIYSGPDRVTAKQQQQELERVARTLPDNIPASVKRFTDRAVLSLQSNPGWGFDKKCQFMDKLVWEVSQHYK